MTRVQTVSLHKVNHSFLGTPQSGETHTSGIALELSIGGFFSSRLYFQVGMREHEEGEEEWDSGEMSGILRFVVPYITPS